jgi:nicotinamidase/pyrazinamidase
MIDKSTALIVVDMQNDFIPGGALAVKEGDQILDGINDLIKISFNNNATIVLSQDWHPTNHRSFASAHKGKKPGDIYNEVGIGPVLWPDHCVQGTDGANFIKGLFTDKASMIIRKGMNPNIDSYSVFLENDKKTETGLHGYLKSREIKIIIIVGLATDYCCYFTALDAKNFGYDVIFIEDLTRGVDLPENNIKKSLEVMKNSGIGIVNSKDKI